MTRSVVAILASLALVAAGCGSSDSEGSSGAKQQQAAKLSAQESTTVKNAVQEIKTSCGAGKKTPEVQQGAEQLVALYKTKGPDAAVAGGGTLDQQLASVQNVLQKCGAADESAKVVGARAAVSGSMSPGGGRVSCRGRPCRRRSSALHSSRSGW